jgi:hypothetical protein
MESIGFKEWALVCEALGRGEQTVILRKGGIAERRAGFGFQHREFFLFPTFFHEQAERVRTPGAKIPPALLGEIEIRYHARVEAAAFVTDWDAVAALAPFHVLAAGVVRERFDYDETRGIHIAFVRVSRVSPAWRFPDERRYGGCRSWVKLPPAPPAQRLEPVISDAAHDSLVARFGEIAGVAAAARRPTRALPRKPALPPERAAAGRG